MVHARHSEFQLRDGISFDEHVSATACTGGGQCDLLFGIGFCHFIFNSLQNGSIDDRYLFWRIDHHSGGDCGCQIKHIAKLTLGIKSPPYVSASRGHVNSNIENKQYIQRSHPANPE